MTPEPAIRATTAQEKTQVLALYLQAFPSEELRPLVSALLDAGPQVLSLAAFDGDALAGHVLFTLCGTGDSGQSGALLGPLGVMPAIQRRGLGTSLIRAGLDRLKARGTRQVFVLGDPAYYARFGFRAERHVQAPYPLPEAWADAWQSMTLMAGETLAGRLRLPDPWINPALWGP